MEVLRTFFGTTRRALWTLLGMFMAFAAIFRDTAILLASNVGVVLHYILESVTGVILAALMPAVPWLVGIGFAVYGVRLILLKSLSSSKPSNKKRK